MRSGVIRTVASAGELCLRRNDHGCLDVRSGIRQLGSVVQSAFVLGTGLFARSQLVVRTVTVPAIAVLVGQATGEFAVKLAAGSLVALADAVAIDGANVNRCCPGRRRAITAGDDDLIGLWLTGSRL